MPVVTIKSTTPGPCACCGIGGAVMSCRTRGGTASLCGYPEWISPSTPPKAYRTLTVGGSYTQDRYSDAGCTVFSGAAVTCTWGGACTYDVATCVLTPGGTQNCGGPTVQNCGDLGGSFTIGSSYLTATQTMKQAQTTGACDVTGLAEWGKYLTATQFATLTDEDLDSDAVARLLAGAGGTWSGYTQVGDGSGGTCAPSSCCRANYAQRTGLSFGYQESQFKLVMSLLDPLTNYVVNVEVYRRLSGSSDPWVLLLVSPFGFTTDGVGGYTITDQDVPNLEGYETFACCPLVYKP